LAKLKCKDYGFECGFVAEGEMELVLQKFARHTDEEHGIDYSKEALMQVILRKST
jgi:predicted small metal-binding protein